MALQIGQELWFVHRERRSGAPFATTVTKVGRKWAELACHYRIDLSTLIADGGNYTSPGRCYLRKEDWEAQVRLETAWDALRVIVNRNYSPPAGLSQEAIEEIICKIRST